MLESCQYKSHWLCLSGVHVSCSCDMDCRSGAGLQTAEGKAQLQQLLVTSFLGKGIKKEV